MSDTWQLALIPAVLAWAWWVSGLVAQRTLRRGRLCGGGPDPFTVTLLLLLGAILVGLTQSHSRIGRRVTGALMLAFGVTLGVSLGISMYSDFVRLGVAPDLTLDAVLVVFLFVVVPILGAFRMLRPGRGQCVLCGKHAFSALPVGEGAVCCSLGCLEVHLEGAGHLDALRRMVPLLVWARRAQWGGVVLVVLGLVAVSDPNGSKWAVGIPLGIMLLASAVFLEWRATRVGVRAFQGQSPREDH